MTKKTLLVVDDEPSFGNLVSEVAKQIGLAPEATHSGKAFQTAFVEHEPAMAVIDIVIPDMDGFELIKWLAKQDHKCPLIFITGNNPAYVEQAASLADVAGLTVAGTLRKPFSASELSTTLAKCLA